MTSWNWNRIRLGRGLLAGLGVALGLTWAVPVAAEGARDAKVVLLTVTDECEFCAIHQRSFRKLTDAAGIRLTVKINNFDPAEQATQVDQALAEHPDAIVLWPADISAIVPSLHKINRAGIPLVISDSKPEDKYASLWQTYAGIDNYAAGQTAARLMIQGFRDKGYGDTGKVFIVIGVPGTAPQVMRQAGFTDTLAEEAPGIRIAGVQPGNWDQTQAGTAAAGLFTQNGNDVQGVYAQADNMMTGVITAAQRAGIDVEKLVLVGQDCSIDGVRNIESGAQYGSVLFSPVGDGEYAARAVIDILDGKEVPHEMIMPSPAITRENVTECYAAIGR
ncbi:LacI family transcriptional regulator [Sinirhodobacter populi]|uniref:LacI family transcriptional regulator n=1 Tax=Paenirhodobacter populi TaxID=2306993 RepID=A0A443KP42_9RHOB|nr:LacI family transcriptional regulator [Sinirhodobacter populi]